MAENRKTFNIKSDQFGEVKVADEVVAIIAGLATTEVEGVSSMAGNITNEIVSRLGMKVKNTVETMTGLTVGVVNVRIASVAMGEN